MFGLVDFSLFFLFNFVILGFPFLIYFIDGGLFEVFLISPINGNKGYHYFDSLILIQ